MKAARWMGASVASMWALTACVTINVYFPAAEAKEAAKEFVEKVIGPDAVPATPAETTPFLFSLGNGPARPPLVPPANRQAAHRISGQPAAADCAFILRFAAPPLAEVRRLSYNDLRLA